MRQASKPMSSISCRRASNRKIAPSFYYRNAMANPHPSPLSRRKPGTPNKANSARIERVSIIEMDESRMAQLASASHSTPCSLGHGAGSKRGTVADPSAACAARATTGEVRRRASNKHLRNSSIAKADSTIEGDAMNAALGLSILRTCCSVAANLHAS